jgi:FolB domain-containing protein
MSLNWSNMDQIIIKGLLVRGVIGITERERERPQDILINVVLFTDISRAAETDLIADCIDYSKIAKKLFAHAEKVERQTVEALASDLARLCLEENGVQGVRMRVEKPGAVRFSRSVGVEIERFRQESGASQKK